MQEIFEVGVAVGEREGDLVAVVAEPLSSDVVVASPKQQSSQAQKVAALLQKVGVAPADLHLSSSDFQKKYGSILHQLTIEYMRNGSGSVVNALRGGNYNIGSDHESYAAFVSSLSGASVWANEAKAACAAEFLGLKLDVEYFATSSTKTPACWNVYSCVDPVLDLTVRNIANTHFYTNTHGDSVANGRCFENTIVAQIQSAAVALNLAPKPKSIPVDKASSSAGLFAAPKPKPGRKNSAAATDDAEAKWQAVYNNTYNDAEREMCQRDHELALRLAAGYDVADQNYDDLAVRVIKRR